MTGGGIASGEARDIAMQGARGVLGADVHEDVDSKTAVFHVRGTDDRLDFF